MSATGHNYCPDCDSDYEDGTDHICSLGGMRERLYELRERHAEAVRLLCDARDFVDECVAQHASNWGEHLMYKQEPAIKSLWDIDAYLAKEDR